MTILVNGLPLVHIELKRRGVDTIASTGTAITNILPLVSRFSSGGGHAARKQEVLERLNAFFERFFGLA